MTQHRLNISCGLEVETELKKEQHVKQFQLGTHFFHSSDLINEKLFNFYLSNTGNHLRI